jgi:hypothetical protein
MNRFGGHGAWKIADIDNDVIDYYHNEALVNPPKWPNTSLQPMLHPANRYGL